MKPKKGIFSFENLIKELETISWSDIFKAIEKGHFDKFIGSAGSKWSNYERALLYRLGKKDMKLLIDSVHKRLNILHKTRTKKSIEVADDNLKAYLKTLRMHNIKKQNNLFK